MLSSVSRARDIFRASFNEKSRDSLLQGNKILSSIHLISDVEPLNEAYYCNDDDNCAQYVLRSRRWF